MSTIPKLEITLADGTEIIVTPNLFDTFGFEKLLKANPRLGSLADNQLKLNAFRAWSAAKRTGVLDMTWEQFGDPNTGVLMVRPAPEPDEDDDAELEVLGLGLDTPAAP
jgi:hypothetical protein